MAAKTASLHIYVLKLFYDIVSFCNENDLSSWFEPSFTCFLKNNNGKVPYLQFSKELKCMLYFGNLNRVIDYKRLNNSG